MKEIKDEEIKIKAEVIDSRRCRFQVDRPVFRAGGTLQFQNRQEAKKSPLAELLFGIEGIAGVLLSFDVVTIQKDEEGDWRVIGKQIGRALRAYLKSEALSFSAELSEPPSDATAEEAIRFKVQRVLDTQINPGVAGHGGQISLLDVRGRSIYLKMGGGCQGCASASMTLKQGIEKAIRQYVPEVDEIIDTTQHAEGKNPFYSPSKK